MAPLRSESLSKTKPRRPGFRLWFGERLTEDLFVANGNIRRKGLRPLGRFLLYALAQFIRRMWLQQAC